MPRTISSRDFAGSFDETLAKLGIDDVSRLIALHMKANADADGVFIGSVTTAVESMWGYDVGAEKALKDTDTKRHINSALRRNGFRSGARTKDQRFIGWSVPGSVDWKTPAEEPKRRATSEQADTPSGSVRQKWACTCGQVFDNQADRDAHMASHATPEEMARKQASSGKYTEMPDGRWRCNACGQVFDRMSQVIPHQRAHTLGVRITKFQREVAGYVKGHPGQNSEQIAKGMNRTVAGVDHAIGPLVKLKRVHRGPNGEVWPGSKTVLKPVRDTVLTTGPVVAKTAARKERTINNGHPDVPLTEKLLNKIAKIVATPSEDGHHSRALLNISTTAKVGYDTARQALRVLEHNGRVHRRRDGGRPRAPERYYIGPSPVQQSISAAATRARATIPAPAPAPAPVPNGSSGPVVIWSDDEDMVVLVHGKPKIVHYA